MSPSIGGGGEGVPQHWWGGRGNKGCPLALGGGVPQHWSLVGGRGNKGCPPALVRGGGGGGGGIRGVP